MNLVKEEEIEEEKKEEPIHIKILIKSGEAFTPYQIKNLSQIGKKNMGYYGACVYVFVGATTIINLYELVMADTQPIVIINLIVPSVISLLSLFRGFAGLLHFLFTKFK